MSAVARNEGALATAFPRRPPTVAAALPNRAGLPARATRKARENEYAVHRAALTSTWGVADELHSGTHVERLVSMDMLVEA